MDHKADERSSAEMFVERENARFGLCEECEEQRVLRCEDVRDALWWIDTGDVA